MHLEIPETMRQEHENLRARLALAQREPGRTGAAASDLARRLSGHMDKEDEFAFQPLALLHALASDRLTPDMEDVLPLTHKLKLSLPVLLAEHSEIVAAAHALGEVAQSEDRLAVAQLAREIVRHAQAEEDVYYPVAILIGEYLRLRFGVL